MKKNLPTNSVKAMHKILYVFLLSFTFILSEYSYGSHMAGGDLVYISIGNGQYIVRYTLYRDCSGIPAPTQVTCNLNSFSCNNFDTSFTLNPIPGTGQQITHNCSGAPTTCDSPPGIAPGIQQYVYEDTITIPAQCPDWAFSVTDCCRNPAITTIDNPGGESMYVESYLNNVQFEHSSPTFSNVPILFECIGQDNIYNSGVSNPAGDSLVYLLSSPLIAGNSPVTYNGTYSIANPITSSPPVSIDSSTGDLHMHPTQVEVGVLAIQINQYRNGILIGTVERDLQIYTVQCSNVLPILSGIDSTSVYTATTCEGAPLCFDVFSNDSNSTDTLTMTWDQGIPGATFIITGIVHPSGHFCWTPGPGTARPQPYPFTVTIRDNACPSNGSRTYSFQIIVSHLSLTVIPQPLLCNGDTNGTACVTAQGLSPFHYTWSSSTNITSCESGLAAGSYSVTVTDISGCSGTRTFTITQPGALIVNSTSTPEICGGHDGSVTQIVSGGTPPYSYSWIPNVSTTSTATGLSAATYVCIVSDSNGCSFSNDTQVNADNLNCCVLVLTTDSTPETCGQLNGTATVTVTGGTAPYTYLWSPSGGTQASATHLDEDTYTVVVTDSNGCSATAVVIVLSDWSNCCQMHLTTSSTPETCGQLNGTASVTATGGTAPYTYHWSPTGGTHATASHLDEDTYTVTVTDANGCSATAVVIVLSDWSHCCQLHLTTSSTPETCGQLNGTATVTATGGTPPYTYHWSPTGGTHAVATHLDEDTYTVTIADANGCQATSIVIVQSDWSHCHHQSPIHNVQVPGEITVYPNPVRGQMNISFRKAPTGSVDISMYDILGNKVYSVQESCTYDSDKTVDMHTLPAGLYLLKIGYDGQMNTFRVIKED